MCVLAALGLRTEWFVGDNLDTRVAICVFATELDTTVQLGQVKLDK